MTRPNLDNFDKILPIILSRRPGSFLCNVDFKQIGRTMLPVAEKPTDKYFFILLNTIIQAADGFGNDAMYHNLCWAKAKKKAEPNGELVNNYPKTLADIGLINFIETIIFQNPYFVFDMSFLNTTYHAILKELNMKCADLRSLSFNYKKQLKELIVENIPDIKAPGKMSQIV